MRVFLNPPRSAAGFANLFEPADYQRVCRFWNARAAGQETPLRLLPALAGSLGLASLAVKDEGARDGLNAFKILGVRYALEQLPAAEAARGLVCATAGNHGRAVARAARDRGLPCTVFLPAARPPGAGGHEVELRTRGARVAAMREDEATVVEVAGSYEDAVRTAAAHAASTGAIVISDTSWPGYEQVPTWIMAGYTWLFEEASRQWTHQPDIILVQGGVGGLVCAAVNWCAWRFGAAGPRVVACEPDGAACLMASAETGHPTSVAGPLDTIMAGLRCAEPSGVAWPSIQHGASAFVSIADATALEAIGTLRAPAGADPAIGAGPSGACGIAAVMALMREPRLAAERSALGLDRSAHALAIVTEGA